MYMYDQDQFHSLQGHMAQSGCRHLKQQSVASFLLLLYVYTLNLFLTSKLPALFPTGCSSGCL